MSKVSSALSSGLSDFRSPTRLPTMDLQHRRGRIRSPLPGAHGPAGLDTVWMPAPVALEPLAHDARVLSKLVGLRSHDGFRLAELTNLAVQSLPAVLFQEILRDLRVNVQSLTRESTAACGEEIGGARTSSTTDHRIVQAQSFMHQ